MKSSKIDDLLKRTEKDEYFWLTDGYCNPVDSKSLNWDNDADSVTSLDPVYADTGIISHMNRSAALVTDMLTCHILYGENRQLINKSFKNLVVNSKL